MNFSKSGAAALSILSNTVLIVFKLITGLAMNSISIISEAIHSSIDLLASLIAFVSIKKASKAEDEDHPFGHGKYENVSGFVEAILIFLAAFLIIYEAIKKIIEGSNIEDSMMGIAVMFIATASNFIISMILLKTAKKTDSIALEADGMHLLTDVYTSLGVFGGLIVVKLTGLKIVDPIAALLVALLIIKASYDLTKKSIVDLVDSRLPEEEVSKITSIICSYSQIREYHRLRTRKSGQRREIDLHLKIDEKTSLTAAHELCDSIEVQIKEAFPESYVVIHVEPDKALEYYKL